MSKRRMEDYCIDYRGLNEITVAFKYPLPLAPAALEQLHSANFFTELNLQSTYVRYVGLVVGKALTDTYLKKALMMTLIWDVRLLRRRGSREKENGGACLAYYRHLTTYLSFYDNVFSALRLL